MLQLPHPLAGFVSSACLSGSAIPGDPPRIYTCVPLGQAALGGTEPMACHPRWDSAAAHCVRLVPLSGPGNEAAIIDDDDGATQCGTTYLQDHICLPGSRGEIRCT